MATRIIVDAKTGKQTVEQFNFIPPPPEPTPPKSEMEILKERIAKLETDVTALKATKEPLAK